MINETKILEIADRLLEGGDMFTVGCTVSPANDIELLLDSDTNVSLDACAELNRSISAALDAEGEDFSLTVASAGIGSELRLPRQYRKLIGGTVEVLLTDGTKITARLEDADDEGIRIRYQEKQSVEGMKRKQTVEVTKEYRFDRIKYTKEYLDYK